jgi:hypothetical protein
MEVSFIGGGNHIHVYATDNDHEWSACSLRYTSCDSITGSVSGQFRGHFKNNGRYPVTVQLGISPWNEHLASAGW